MSVVYYKFKSSKEFDTYVFEGAGVPLWELKNAIVHAKRLSKATDTELILFEATSGEGMHFTLI